MKDPYRPLDALPSIFRAIPMRVALGGVLLLHATGAAALSLHAAPPTARWASASRAAGVVCVEADVDVTDDSFVDPGMKGAKSWQEELETLLAPETSQEEREMMLKDLLARAPEISEEVQAALQSQDVGSLLPESSRSKQLIDDIGVVQRQVVEDILPLAASEAQAVLGSAVREAPALAESVAQRGPALLALLQDPA